MSRNTEVAEILFEFADLLDAKDVEYKPRAYRRAAENVLEYPVAIEEVAEDGEEAMTKIEGVGDAIAGKIVEYLSTGRIDELDELREEYPVRMDELTAVEGVGPKTVGSLYDALGITTLDELEEAATTGTIQTVKGFGPKTEENILEHIPFAREAQQRELLGHGRPVADEVLTYLEAIDCVSAAEVAGSIRRWRATIGDIDILVGTEDGEAVIDHFTGWDRIERIIEAGETKVSVRARGIQVDIRLVSPNDWGAALQYFTGSKDHNVRLRNRAIDQSRKMNEYGVFEIDDTSAMGDVSDPRAGNRIAGETEESMYESLGLEWIPPELREDTGEIAAAAEGRLPSLVTVEDIRGDLHVHTDWSDGNGTIEEMVAAAEARGYTYVGICDHATGPGMVGGVGLSDDEIREQIEEVRDVESASEIPVLAGIEANIDGGGEISVDDDVLAELDIVVASPHSDLDQDRDAATNRIIAAIEHPSVDIIGHPSGRLLNSRPGIELAIDQIADVAAREGTALEINANPRRLDLHGTFVKAAIEAGAPLAINTDAHSPGEYGNIRYGVHTARRGWAEPADIVNTYQTESLEQWLRE